VRRPPPTPPRLPARRPALRQQLAAADKDAVYPLLKWVLAQPELLRKRAFVGYYLSLPEVGAHALAGGKRAAGAPLV
jgi:hypothetical protein